MRVRVMTVADYDGVRRLWDGAPGIGLDAVDDARDGVAKYLRRNPTTSFVAEDLLYRNSFIVDVKE